jgi:hypothetical protein
MTCTDCSAAQQTNGLWRQFNPLCLHCGARIVQCLRGLARPAAEIAKRQRAEVAHWMTFGHSEQDIRALAKEKMLAIAPESAEPKKKKGK